MGSCVTTRKIAEGDLGGGLRFRLVEVRPSTSYASGGDTLSGREHGLTTLLGGLVAGSSTSPGRYLAVVDHATSKLGIYDISGGAEAAGDLSALRFLLYLIGR